MTNGQVTVPAATGSNRCHIWSYIGCCAIQLFGDRLAKAAEALVNWFVGVVNCVNDSFEGRNRDDYFNLDHIWKLARCGVESIVGDFSGEEHQQLQLIQQKGGPCTHQDVADDKNGKASPECASCFDRCRTKRANETWSHDGEVGLELLLCLQRCMAPGVDVLEAPLKQVAAIDTTVLTKLFQPEKNPAFAPPKQKQTGADELIAMLEGGSEVKQEETVAGWNCG